MTRRLFLTASAVFSAMAALPLSLSALTRNDGAFKQEKLADAIKALYGTSKTSDGKVNIKAPEIAENGAAVPVTISSDADGVESLALFVEGNPRALVSYVNVPKNGIPSVATRIKLAKTSNVVAVAKINGTLYQTKKNVKVTIGGCGG